MLCLDWTLYKNFSRTTSLPGGDRLGQRKALYETPTLPIRDVIASNRARGGAN